MSKTKLLAIAVIGLLLINSGMIIYLFSIKPGGPPPHGGPHHRHEGPKNIIIERLRFDDQQVALYEELIHGHRADVGRLERQIHEAKNELYSSLGGEQEVNVDSLQNNIAALQKEMETVHYNHFTDIKRLCKPEQQAYFRDLANDLADFFNPRRKP